MPYAELWCKSNFSFLEGASQPEELVTRADELELHALAITDRNTLAGIVRAFSAQKGKKVKLLIGAEIVPTDAPAILLLARNLTGYRTLSRLITRGRRAAEKGECILTLNDLAEHTSDLLAIATCEIRHDAASVLPYLNTYRELFADRAYLAAAVHRGPQDDEELQRFAHWSRQTQLPLVATNQVHYHVPARRRLHDVLTAVRHHTTVANLGAVRFPNGERHLKSAHEMACLFAPFPEALARTVEVAERCTFTLEELRYHYPAELCPDGETPASYLTSLTWVGARERYPGGVPDKVQRLLERELALIVELRYEAFFLTVWDLVQYARSRSILCQGRGSAANSAVCYCLGITSVNPDSTDLLFERFISKERNEAPDIDVDFEHERREEVFQYIYRKYGRDRAGIVAEVITYQPKSAVRDVGKALGLSLDAVDRLAKTIDWSSKPAAIAERIVEAGLDPRSRTVQHLVELTTELFGFPRHLSQHVGGFVITGGPLSELVPLENAAMADRTVIQWDKDDLDTLGILKVDCLSLGMLTAIHKCFDLVEQHYGQPLTLASIPCDDTAVFDMICNADTVGVFQIESRAQMSMLPRLKPRCFYDLVIEVAIVRPGPIQGGMVHPFLRRRNGEEPITYPHPVVEEVLSKTLGVPLFQEQVMRLAIVAAGFTPGEADQLRRAMGAWKRTGVIDRFREKFRQGLLARGFPETFTDEIYEMIRGFGQYGFPESHAASFALLAYVSAWLKCHYPGAFAASIINSQPMGFYGPAQLIYDAQAHGVTALPVDMNFSAWDCLLEGKSDPAIRLGFRLIKGFSQEQAERIVRARGEGPFRSIADLVRRTGVSKALLARLAAADGFGSLGLERRAALWQVLATGEELPLFAGLDDDDNSVPPLPSLSRHQQVVADYQSTGLSLKSHPIGLVREDLDRLKVTPASKLIELSPQASVRVAGLVMVRQRPPTANGTVFISLEDETGLINLIVWARTWEKFRKFARHAVALFVEGRIEKAERVIHVCPTFMEDLSQALRGLASQSRDFR